MSSNETISYQTNKVLLVDDGLIDATTMFSETPSRVFIGKTDNEMMRDEKVENFIEETYASLDALNINDDNHHNNNIKSESEQQKEKNKKI